MGKGKRDKREAFLRTCGLTKMGDTVHLPAFDATQQERALGALVADVLAQVTAARGVDIEIVVDTDGTPWVVQARPLTVDPFPRWTTMKAAIDEAGAAEGPG